MKRYFTLTGIFLSLAWCVAAQSGQLTLPRVAQMPDLPSPYEMRNWKDVAIKYDQLLYYGTGTPYFPLSGIQPTGTNYPLLSPILMQSYVGGNINSAEGINVIPSVVGASLVGVNKSNQSGTNWAEKTKDYFNKKNGQNVYLNNWATVSGGDWWYDVMPNIFFYQLYSQYPSITDYNTQFTTVADRWLESVKAMGGKTAPWTVPNMNYRAWRLATMTGLADGVKQPEAAGGIGWLLYHAYLVTGEKKYLEGAQLSLEFLTSLTANPSYELQLPYGAFIAAKMNAELGTSYDVPKILGWCFAAGSSNPRGWGVITGKWDGKDVGGLIGEANNGGNDYAFALNGFQQAAALVPLIKYDKRYAHDLAKWTLNLANASRFFYTTFPTSEDDRPWAQANDPNAVIAYEALKEKDSWNSNKPLNATGDAKRGGWASTNLGLYGSSSVGYLAAVVETTDVPGILLLDLNKTDFFLGNTYPMYALYNPYGTDKLVTLNLPAGSHDIYDAISEQVIASGVSGTTQVTVKADEAVLLVYVPAGTTLTEDEGKLYANNKIIDYHYGYDFTAPLRIKSLSATNTTVEFNTNVTVYLTVDNAQPGATYQWSDGTGNLGTFSTPAFTWHAPATAGLQTLTVTVTSNGEQVTSTLEFNVVETIPQAPVISSISSPEKWQPSGTQILFTCNVTDDHDSQTELTYAWDVSAGTITGQTGNTITWQAPSSEGIYSIACEVTDTDGITSTLTRQVLVKHASSGTVTAPFAYYPLDGNVRDYSGNEYNATQTGVTSVFDARGETGKAYLFDLGTDIIKVENSTELNFQDMLTASFWVKANSIPEESFILSHGSWEERWKTSLTPSGNLRFTVKTNTGIKDLDGSFVLELNRFYHFTVVFTGYSMEIYADGELDTFMAHSGFISTTTKALTFGRKQEDVASYFLRGVIDEVRIYNAIVPPDEIITLKDIWNEVVTGVEKESERIQIYPNPATREFFLHHVNLSRLSSFQLFDVNGRVVPFEAGQAGEDVKISVTNGVSGVVILKWQSGGNPVHQKIILK